MLFFVYLSTDWIQTLTGAPEGKTMHSEPGREFDDQGKFDLICLLENM